MENAGAKALLMETTKLLRKEKEREKELLGLEEHQKSELVTNDQRLRRLQLYLSELRQSAMGASSQALLRRLEEECSVNTYICKQKLPQEIQIRRTEVEILENVYGDPNMNRSEIDNINDKVKGDST